MGAEATYVEDQYLPEGFTFKEPSKLSKAEVYECLKFWYGRQQDGGAETAFKFRCIKGKNGKPKEVVTEEQLVEVRKKKKPGRKQGRAGKGKERQEDTPSDGHSSESEVPEPAPKKARRKATKRRPKPQESSDSSSESPSENHNEEDEEDSMETPGRLGLAPALQLPFGPVPRKPTPGPSRLRKPTAGPSNKRYDPATGPQYEKPNTRRRALNSGDEGGPAKKQKTVAEQVVKVGPPKGVKKNMTKGKGNGKK
jgi:hypothetical protein